MNIEQERAAFEAWANGRCELHLVNPAGRYSSAITQFAWEAYQAGRAALAAQPAATTTAPSDENGGHRLMEPDHETALALADAPRSLQNYVAALRSAIDAALAEENKA